MLLRAAIIVGLFGAGLLLNGCTKCGPIWDDWLQPQSETTGSIG